jgi:asparagine synthase (glutamine-hydrolysing)
MSGLTGFVQSNRDSEFDSGRIAQAMQVSLKTGIPVLDPGVADTVWRLPHDMKITGNDTKWALHQIIHKYVPRELIDRPKTGFSISLGAWLRGPVRDWAEALVDPARLRAEGFFKPKPIEEVWKQHISRRYDWSLRLQTVLMFRAWMDLIQSDDMTASTS